MNRICEDGEVLGVGRRRLIDMRVAVGSDQGDDIDAVAADLFHHVAEDRERGDGLDLVAGLRRSPRPSSTASARPIGSEKRRLFMTRTPCVGDQASRCLRGTSCQSSAAAGADQHREEIEHAAGEDDRGAGRQIGVIGDQQPGQARREGDSTATRIIPDMSSAQKRAAIAGSSMMPTTISVPSAWKPATRFITTSTRKGKWVGELKRADRAQELRVEAFEHERPVDRWRAPTSVTVAIAGDQDQRRVVKREHRAEQHVQQVDVAALHRDDQHAERERHEIEGGKARVLAQDGGAGDEAGEQRHGDAGDKAAKAHGRHREAGDEEADRRAGQDGVAHGVAHQAHAAEHEEHADRRRAERERKAADQRPAHEGEFDEGIDQGVDHAGSARRRLRRARKSRHARPMPR